VTPASCQQCCAECCEKIAKAILDAATDRQTAQQKTDAELGRKNDLDAAKEIADSNLEAAQIVADAMDRQTTADWWQNAFLAILAVAAVAIAIRKWLPFG
jgi:hypothetical protein